MTTTDTTDETAPDAETAPPVSTDLHPLAETAPARAPLGLEQRALRGQLMQHFPLIERPVSEWGLVGQGDVVAGHMDLVDVETLERVRAFPGATILEDRVFANVRNLPAKVRELLGLS
jgi:hypothetical protein